MDLVSHAFDGTAAYAPQGIGARSVLPTPEGGARTPSFGDMLSALNPLQHLPVVGAIYRHVTGDVPHPAAQVVGGAIFGGPLGFVAGLLSTALEQATGKTPLQVAIGAIAPQTPQEPLAALAQAMPEAEPPGVFDVADQQSETPPPQPPIPPAGAIVVARMAAPAPAPRPQPPAPHAPASQQTATAQGVAASESQVRPAPSDPQSDAPPPPPPAARVAAGRDLAFYQSHAGGRLPPAASAGNGRALMGGPQIQRAQPHAQPASLSSARDPQPVAQRNRMASLAADLPAVASAAQAATEAPQRGDDFATRMLHGLERYRAMSRAGDARAAAPAVVLTQ